MPRKAGPEWLLKKAARDGDFSSESLAWILASLSVGDVRAMFWTAAEFAAAFQMSVTAAKKFLRGAGIPCVRFTKGPKAFYSKVSILEALQQATQGDPNIVVIESEEL